MSTVKSLYRSTLIAAALTAAGLSAAPAAEAHEQGWRERGGERPWHAEPGVRWYRGPRGHAFGGRRYLELGPDCESGPAAPVYYPVVPPRPPRPWAEDPSVEYRAPY